MQFWFKPGVSTLGFFNYLCKTTPPYNLCIIGLLLLGAFFIPYRV